MSTAEQTTRTPRDFDDSAALDQPSVIGAMWRYRWVVIPIVILFVGLGLAFNAYSPGGYEATAELIVQDPASSGRFDPNLFPTDPGQTPQRYVADQVKIISGPGVAERASELSDGAISTDSFLTNVTVSSDSDSNLVEISFTAAEPGVAQQGANLVVVAYEDVTKQQLQDSVESAIEFTNTQQEALVGEISDLQTRIAVLVAEDEISAQLEEQFTEAIGRLNAAVEELGRISPISDRAAALSQEIRDLNLFFESTAFVNGIRQTTNAPLNALLAQQTALINQGADLAAQRNQFLTAVELAGAGITSKQLAALPTDPTGAGPARMVAAGIVLGLAVGAAVSYFLAVRRRSFSNRLLPERVLNAPLLAEVPDFSLEGIKSPLPVKTAPTSASAEAFRFAAAAVDIRAHAAGAKSLMVVSATLSAGKTITAANTAIAAAREGLRVLVVDADFGNQELTGLLLGDSQPDVGITEVVEGLIDIDAALKHVVVTDDRSLYLLSRGRRPAEAATFFRAESTQRFFAEVRNRFDLVIIDGPPLLQVAYASTLVRYVDAAIVIVPHNSRVSELEEVADRLHFIQTPAVGYVYTKAPLRPEMTASEGSMKDILGMGVQAAESAKTSSPGRRRR